MQGVVNILHRAPTAALWCRNGTFQYSFARLIAHRGMRPLKETVYVLYSLKDRHFYVGYTSNLELRLAEHEEGLVNCTARRRPFMLLHTETYLLKSEALRRENYFKSWQGKRALRLMLQESLLVLSRQ